MLFFFLVVSSVIDKATDTSEDTIEVMNIEEFLLPFDNQDELHGHLNSVEYYQMSSFSDERNSTSMEPCIEQSNSGKGFPT